MKAIRQFNVFLHGIAALLLVASATAYAQPAGTVTYIHNDFLGSPVAATDASGTVIWRESFSGYGERKNQPADTEHSPRAANKVWYTSRHQDEDTGLVYLGARYYDPAIGRFLSMDSVGFDEKNVHSFNRYVYANNNPYKFIDPDGSLPLLADSRAAPFIASLRNSPEAAKRIEAIEKSDATVRINFDDKFVGPMGDPAVTQAKTPIDITITINPESAKKFEFKGRDGQWHPTSVQRTLAHELAGHAYDVVNTNIFAAFQKERQDKVIRTENRVMQELVPGSPNRIDDHGNANYFRKTP